jgi:hypothetical protein
MDNSGMGRVHEGDEGEQIWSMYFAFMWKQNKETCWNYSKMWGRVREKDSHGESNEDTL